MESIFYLIPIFFLGAFIAEMIEYFQKRSVEKEFPKREEEFDDSGIEWDIHSRV
jgi:hypothetical protein